MEYFVQTTTCICQEILAASLKYDGLKKYCDIFNNILNTAAFFAIVFMECLLVAQINPPEYYHKVFLQRPKRSYYAFVVL